MYFSTNLLDVTGPIIHAAAVISVHLAAAQLIHAVVLGQTHLRPDLDAEDGEVTWKINMFHGKSTINDHVL